MNPWPALTSHAAAARGPSGRRARASG
ncbi:hypothetical protein E2C01_070727 [Portunus trituberculatus]|uniref:Uncharacterized protein n=1 Tax=Portunus trituberculatus TaxID=210409 RepID=A0A5B7I4A5_PORTR|nr:hypothetical protein [Portunus trituberculatus]